MDFGPPAEAYTRTNLDLVKTSSEDEVFLR